MHVVFWSVVKLRNFAAAGVLILLSPTLVVAEEATPSSNPDGVASICDSTLAFAKGELTKSNGTAVRDQASKAPGDGGLCAASEFVVTTPLKIYRLSAWQTPDYDRWWTLEVPSGSASVYRQRNVMCGNWPVNYRTTCTLEEGTVIAVGYGQSLRGCGGPSATIQIFVPGDRDAVKSKMVANSCVTEQSLMEP